MSDLDVSPIGLGTDQFGSRVDQDGARRIVFAALDAGINFIDTAHIYGDGLSEEYVGRAIESVRHRLVIATKGGHTHTGGPTRKKLVAELETSLRRLKTDHIDLYQVHFLIGESTPIDEIIDTLIDMQTSGKIRHFGASNFYAWQLCHANHLCSQRGKSGFVSIQSHYSLVERDVESELIAYCEQSGVALLPFYPLAGGLLAGRYQRGTEPAPDTRAGQLDWARRFYSHYATTETFDLIDRLADFARARGRNFAELAIAWLRSRPAVCSVIVGASKPEHVVANARACTWKLTEAEVERIAALTGNDDTCLRYPRRLWWETRKP